MRIYSPAGGPSKERVHTADAHRGTGCLDVVWRAVLLFLVVEAAAIAYLSAHWPTGAVAVVALLIGFLVGKLRYEAKIDGLTADCSTKKSTIDGLTAMHAAHVALLERQVGTSSPDEIKAQIDGFKSEVATLKTQVATLEAGLAVIRPRRLSADAIDKMSTIMSKSSGFLRVVLPKEQVNDAHDYGRDFRKVIERAGWKTDYTMPFATFGQSLHGLCLVVPDPSSLTPAQALISAALSAAELSFDVQAEPKWPTRPGVLPDPNHPDAMLVISRKGP